MEDRGLEGQIAAIAANRARVTDLVVNPTADRSGWKITAPVTRGGVLSGAMDLVPPPGFINEFLRPLALPPGWQWDIFDRRGAVIARSPYAEQQPDRRPAETEGVSWTTGTGAPAALQAVYRLKSIDWRGGGTGPAPPAGAALRNACPL